MENNQTIPQKQLISASGTVNGCHELASVSNGLRGATRHLDEAVITPSRGGASLHTGDSATIFEMEFHHFMPIVSADYCRL
jgi:hypothetical protein